MTGGLPISEQIAHMVMEATADLRTERDELRKVNAELLEALKACRDVIGAHHAYVCPEEKDAREKAIQAIARWEAQQ
jgi:flagellar biosynthesis/type III secretory pathway protein FliH